MARPSPNSTQYDSIASYMDGVQVKITNKYQSPPNLVFPEEYYVKPPDPARYTYNFNLEKNVLAKASGKLAQSIRADIEHGQMRHLPKSIRNTLDIIAIEIQVVSTATLL
ncbi:unnamed protein product [Trichogramma brassicae]|uniref:UMA domain-containing protein n=1 Tax=Trichogramma brassicae TaxID=86971 RepID=A0A6H5IXW8_9HYME|nr:unnamed protein product [Trichogramma brassicae]